MTDFDEAEKAAWAQAEIYAADVKAAWAAGFVMIIEGFNDTDMPDYEGDDDNHPLAPTNPWIIQQLGFDPKEFDYDEDPAPEPAGNAEQ